jgi:hypothetical protein
MRSRRSWIALLAVAAAVTLVGGAGAVTGAGFTTINETFDGGNFCQNGNPAINCNIYGGKQYVWMNGGPVSAQVGDGDYFFAVLVPGGQGGNENPNDGTPKNLSDVSPTSGTGAGDDWTNRVFSISGGVISYLGTHDFDDNKIRLMPYDDTTNPGGVYIMAICNLADRDESAANQPGVDPSHCKYDAFKVRENPPPPNQVASCFSGTKYRDDDKSGALNDPEIGLSGWLITLDPGTPGNTSDDLTATTDADGNWSACEPAHDPAEGTTSYTVSETQQDGWKQTGNIVDQSIVFGGATVSLSNFVYTVGVPNNANASADGLNFGNIPQGKVWGAKYYDTNLNGKYDAGEVLISGWKIKQDTTIFSTIAAFTDGNGFAANFVRTLDPGTYAFSEVQASNWIQTGNTVNQTTDLGATTGGASASLANKAYSVTIPNNQPSSVSKVYFGNVCLGAGGGLTLGFWSNKNGQALFGSDDLALMVSLNLRNANGSAFDPGNYAAFKTWLLSATATNMAYMLSAQLAAMELNVLNGKVNGNALIYAPGSTSANSLGFATVNAVMAEANASLLTNGYTVAAGPTRTYQEALKNALDNANNNLNFLQGSPATCATPIFPAS